MKIKIATKFIQTKLINNYYYIVNMSASANKNRDIVGENETLFDFLKRKKKYNLQNTLNKTLAQHSYTKKKFDYDNQDHEERQQATKATNYQSNNEAHRGTRQTITPKKIEFQEPKNNKSLLKQAAHIQYQPIQGKSFLSMISPLKNRPPPVYDENDDKQNLPRSNKKVNRVPQCFSKKNVTKSINTIKQAMNSLSDKIKILKQKSYGLVLQFKPLSNSISESNSSLSKQIGDFRNKLKAFQVLIDSASVQDIDEIVQTFHKNFQEHLQLQQGHIRKTLEKGKEQEILQIRNQKDRLIDHLQAQNKKLKKQMDILQRRLQKAENHHQNIQQAVTEREMTKFQQLQRVKMTYQVNIEQLKQKNLELLQKCQQLTEENKYLEKQLKNQRFSNQRNQQMRRQQIQKIIETKDAYLLNQIMVLKTQFNNDLNRINELHEIKEAQLMSRIEKKKEQINKLNFERGCDRQIQSKILQEANQIKQENGQLKAKVQCIITDMYRMNEQLYQHWMALKDIKALSNRLGSFAQYRKIYEDLLFNEQLFH